MNKLKSIKIAIISAGILLIQVHFASAQNYEKIVFGADKEDYYLAVKPLSADIQGVLVLLPGFGSTAEGIFPETKIQNVAYLHGLLTVAIAAGKKLYADESVVVKLNKALQHVKETYGISEDQFVIGGFSAGGTIALRYAEYCVEKPNEMPIVPQAVFSVDSPVDLFEIWSYFQRELKKNYSEAGVDEAMFVSELMLREIGDSEKGRLVYEQLTPFHMDLETPGNEQFLNKLAVRTYHDVDVVWQLQNRRRSLRDMNAFPASEMINRLLLSGNEQAEFIQAKERGRRSIGYYHPHSWSIVDDVDLVLWVMGSLMK